jgi:hypothetical protein
MTRPLQTIRIALVAGTLLATGLAQTGSSNPNPATSGSPGTTGATAPGQTAPVRESDRHDFNMGWLGLVGLAGLLGLRRHTHRHDEPRNIDNTGPSAVR